VFGAKGKEKGEGKDKNGAWIKAERELPGAPSCSLLQAGGKKNCCSIRQRGPGGKVVEGQPERRGGKKRATSGGGAGGDNHRGKKQFQSQS